MKLKYQIKRAIENVSYNVGSILYNLEVKKYFDVELNGEDKLPGGSAVLAFNHTFGLDGMLTCLGFPRPIHHLIQYEGIHDKSLRNRICSWAVGFIPVSVGILDEEGKLKVNSVNSNINRRAWRRARDYLENYRDFVGVFIDGPASRLLDKNGKPIPKCERTASESAASFSLSTERPIVPVGIWMPEDVAERLWEFGPKKKEENAAYLLDRQKKFKTKKEALIPYQINVGMPIYPMELNVRSSEKRKILTEMLKREIVRLGEKQD